MNRKTFIAGLASLPVAIKAVAKQDIPSNAFYGMEYINNPNLPCYGSIIDCEMAKAETSTEIQDGLVIIKGLVLDKEQYPYFMALKNKIGKAVQWNLYKKIYPFGQEYEVLHAFMGRLISVIFEADGHETTYEIQIYIKDV